MKMRSMMLTGLRKMEMMEEERPHIHEPDDVLIRMECVGVCGSDVHYYETGRIGCQVVKFPFPLGHEGSGTVIEVGKNVRRVKPGDRIAIDPAMFCGTCDQCQEGRFHTCRKLRFLGCPGQSSGCLREYIVMPEKCCFPLPPNLTFEDGALSEPLAIGMYAVHLAERLIGDVKDKNILILGCGPIGLSVMLPLRTLGARYIAVTDKLNYRLQMAKELGADTTANPNETDITKYLQGHVSSGFHLVFECCGDQEAVDQGLSVIRPGGKFLIIGIPPTMERWSFPVDLLRHREVCIQNVRRQVEHTGKTIEWLANGKLGKASRMITHRFSFERTPEAFELVSGYQDGVVKAMIHFYQ